MTRNTLTFDFDGHTWIATLAPGARCGVRITRERDGLVMSAYARAGYLETRRELELRNRVKTWIEYGGEALP
jgi:hypothetical protein